ncbi:MAG: EAL domain-containing protein [Rhodocyclaceae bacterium]|nr:EAL domain-containing protein [Rhodocyclaceae bacterium]
MSVREIPRWIWLAAGLLALVLLLVLAAGSLSDARRIAAANNNLAALDQQQAKLSENVLKLRYGLISNYDGINQLVAETQRASAALGAEEGAIAAKGNARIDALYRQYTAALKEHCDHVERFKSGNALLKNSLHYFPRAVEDVQHGLPRDGGGQALSERLGDLYFATLRYGTGADESLSGAVADGIGGIRNDAERLPPPRRKEVLNVLAHAEVILHYRPAVDALTQQIVFPATTPLVRELGRAIQDDALAGERLANRFRLGLAALAGLLLFGVSLSLLRLMRNAQQLEDSHRFMDRISENIGDGVLATDKDGAIIFANREAARLTGYERAALLGKNLRDALPGSSIWQTQYAFGIIRSDDEQLRRSDGSVLPIALVHATIHEAGQLGAVMAFRDMTEVRARQKDLQLAATVFEHSPYGIMVTDGAATILRVNPAFRAITGYGEGEVAGKTPAVLKSGLHQADFYQNMWSSLRDEGQWKGELQNRRKNGNLFPEWLSIRAVKGKHGDITHYVGIFSDLSEHKESERRLEYLANYDTLTGLPNRVLFQDRLNQAIAHMGRGNRILALMYAGLDHFKVVNETLGVDIGDALLKAVAGRLLAGLRDTDTVCRLSGDQFAILLDDVRNVADIASKAQAVLRAFERPFEIDGHVLFTSLSIGITLAPLDASDAATLQRNADTAMFGAKELGRNTLQFYSADMSARMAEALRLENGLRRALEAGEFALHYQPQWCLSSNRVVCVEALLRWTSAEFGAVSPTSFIPVAEKCGLIVPIGAWVLRTACAQVAAWRRSGDADVRVAVNLSAVQFRQTDLVDLVRGVLAEYQLEGRQLELEITESVVMEDVGRSIATLNGLRALGCEIAIDDFGTGYSSLNYLKQFPLDTLKIDQSFVRGLGSNSDDAAVVNAIVSLGASLSLKIVAEGVELDEQRSFLENLGGQANMLLQGYHICRPVPADEVAAFLGRSQTRQ